MTVRACIALSMLWLALAGQNAAHAQGAPVAADISADEIAITSSFSGANLLLFGARGDRIPDEPFDVIAVIHGPETPMKIWRRERVAGIWVNSEPVTFENVPGYYAVASNRPAHEITSEDYLRSQNIGFDNLVLISVEDVPVAEKVELRKAIVGERAQSGLYLEAETAVSFPAGNLFRTDLHFPANVPVGDYRVIVRLFQRGAEVGRSSSVLSIGKTGLEQYLYSLAHERPMIYGIGAVILAMLAGWVAAVIFRKT